MNSTSRLTTLVAVVVIVAILAATWFVGIAPRLGEIAKADDDRETIELQNEAHEATLRGLEELAEREDELNDDLEALRASIPDDVELSTILRRLDGVAESTGTTIKVLSMVGPEPFAPLDPAVEAEAGAGTSNAITDPEYVAALGSVTAENFYTIALTFEVIGDYAQTMAAVEQVQLSERFTLVTDVVFKAGEATVITGQLFIARDAADVPEPVAPVTDPVEGAPAPE